MSDTPNFKDAVGVQVYCSKKIELADFPKIEFIEQGEEDHKEEVISPETVAKLKAMGVVYYRDSNDASGIVIDPAFTGKGWYSFFYVDEDMGSIGKVFNRNKKVTVVELTAQSVRWK